MGRRLRPLVIFPVGETHQDFKKWAEGGWKPQTRQGRSEGNTGKPKKRVREGTFFGVLLASGRPYGLTVEGYRLDTGIIVAPWTWWLWLKRKGQKNIGWLEKTFYWAQFRVDFSAMRPTIIPYFDGKGVPDWLDLEGYPILPLQTSSEDKG